MLVSASLKVSSKNQTFSRLSCNKKLAKAIPLVYRNKLSIILTLILIF